MLKPTRTAKRLEWLRRLLPRPSRYHGKGRVAYDCRRLGWTEWNYRSKTGGVDMTGAAAKEAFGDQYWLHVNITGERLTEEGRRIAQGEDHGSEQHQPADGGAGTELHRPAGVGGKYPAARHTDGR